MTPLLALMNQEQRYQSNETHPQGHNIKMFNSIAYWITPDNEILDIGLGTHIDMVIKHPEFFGLTKEEITSIYQKYNELMGVEGKARYKIIMQLLTSGFIRIRLYPNKYWSVSVRNWDGRTKDVLSQWAEIAIKVKNAGQYMGTVISTQDQVIKDYTVKDLILNKHKSVTII